jgi:hypothetical protein
MASSHARSHECCLSLALRAVYLYAYLKVPRRSGAGRMCISAEVSPGGRGAMQSTYHHRLQPDQLALPIFCNNLKLQNLHSRTRVGQGQMSILCSVLHRHSESCTLLLWLLPEHPAQGFQAQSGDPLEVAQWQLTSMELLRSFLE